MIFKIFRYFVSFSINWLPMFLKVCDILKINAVLGKTAQCEMWSSNPVISIKLPQQLVGELCHVPLNTWPACVKKKFHCSLFLGSQENTFTEKIPNFTRHFLSVSPRFEDVFWFLLDMTNDDRIPLRMTFDNLGDNISHCHSFIWHPASPSDQPRSRLLLSSSSSGLGLCLNTKY